MVIAPDVDSASSWLTWSNVVYIVGAVLTLIAAMHVRHEKRSVEKKKQSRVSFASEASVIAAAIVSLCGTAGAVYFSDRVGHFKDVALSFYEKDADERIATAHGVANTAAENTEKLKNQNLLLQQRLDVYNLKQLGDEDSIAKVRSVTDERTALFSRAEITALKAFAGCTIYFGIDSGDKEQKHFRSSLIAGLRPSITVVTHDIMGVGAGFFSVAGIHIRYTQLPKSKELAEQIQTILKNSRLVSDLAPNDPKTREMHDNADPNVLIYVGPKP